MKRNLITWDGRMKAPGSFELPKNHSPGLRVPKGGSSCSNCKHLGADGKSCDSKLFAEWNGSRQLPAAADEYCSDWWEPKV